MRWFHKLPLRLRSLFHKGRVEKELSEELRFHLEKLVEESLAKGMAPEQARYAALRELGGVAQIKEECRDARGLAWLENLFRDLRFGVRQLRRNPGFATIAIITLALGIGATTAVFSLVEAALFPPFAVSNPGRLAGVYTSGPNGLGYSSTSYPDYVYYRDHNRVFSGLMAYAHIPLRWTHGDQTDFIPAAIASSNYFSVLGIEPFIGRFFTAQQDASSEGPAIAVVSYQFWTRRLAANTKVIGGALNLNGHLFTIVGVAPKGFAGVDLAWGAMPDIWVTMSAQAVALPANGGVDLLHSRQARFLLVMGRLRSGVNLQQAGTEAQVAARQLAQAYPASDKGRTASVLTANESRMWPGWRNSVVQTLLLLGVAVAFVLLIACANVANLLLARATERRQETAVRLALGGSRRRIVRQLLTETLLLSVIGAMTGLLFARLAMRLIPSLELTFRMHMNLHPRPDYRVFLFALLIAAFTAFIFGLIPALKASDIDLSQSLKEASRRTSARGSGLRNTIVTLEVVFAFFSLIGGGLFIRSLRRLGSADPGFRAANVLAVSMILLPNQYSPARGTRFYARLLDRVSTLPGIRSVCFSGSRPLTMTRIIKRITLEGQERAPEAGIETQVDTISPGYFKTLGIPLLRGRDFTPQDDAQAPRVVIINRTLVRSLWPRQNPIGKRFKLEGENGYREVAGVVAGIKYHTIWESPEPYMYLPLAQAYDPAVSLMVQTKGSPLGYLTELRKAVGTLDSSVPVYGAESLEEQVRRSLSQPRTIATLLGLFGAIALVLALVGIYGVVSRSVAARTHEIGIRMALGAQKNDVLKIVIAQGLKLALIGVGIGVIAALGLTRFLASLLYGVTPADPLTFVIVSLVLIGVALLACYIPARRATKVDPMAALRCE